MTASTDAEVAPPKAVGERAIVTIIGPDRVGIIAGIAQVLADGNANIIDISQTVMREFFAMMMIVDITGATLQFDRLRQRLQTKGAELSVQVEMQREEIFKAMHRV